MQCMWNAYMQFSFNNPAIATLNSSKLSTLTQQLTQCSSIVFWLGLCSLKCALALFIIIMPDGKHLKILSRAWQWRSCNSPCVSQKLGDSGNWKQPERSGYETLPLTTVAERSMRFNKIQKYAHSTYLWCEGVASCNCAWLLLTFEVMLMIAID